MFLVKDAHYGGLADHFGINKTIDILKEYTSIGKR